MRDTCACGDECHYVCTHCHEPTCIDCFAPDSTTLCRDCDRDDDAASDQEQP